MRQSLLLAAITLSVAACGAMPARPSAATNVIPWIDTAPSFPTPTPAAVMPAGTRPCSLQNLRMTYEGAGGLGGGQLSATIGFMNLGSDPCSLQGFPRLTLLDSRGSAIVTTPSGYLLTDRADAVLLAPAGRSRQAYVPFAWPAIDMATGGGECPSAVPADSIRITLPSGGTQTIAALQPSDRPMRATIAPCHGQLAVGAFQAVEPVVDPTPTPHPFHYRVSLPASVRAGGNLNYTVTLTNATAAPFTFGDPCPNYHEDLYLGQGALGRPLGKHIYSLNCRPVKTIAPQTSVTFAMLLDVPASAMAGHYTLLWAPDEGLDTQDIQRLPIKVTR